MEIPEDIFAMLQKVPMRSSARNLTQLTQLLSDGTIVAHMIHASFPRMIQMHNYTNSTNTETKLDNWRTLNSKVLSKLKFIRLAFNNTLGPLRGMRTLWKEIQL